ncbi:MAG: hypothetical protein EON55_01880 [Alphaproteobacteria bacterium]|nr:MAG: hypothetical protein EON55_01880 [Alphaproteobacteria bacterium]
MDLLLSSVTRSSQRTLNALIKQPSRDAFDDPRRRVGDRDRSVTVLPVARARRCSDGAASLAVDRRFEAARAMGRSPPTNVDVGASGTPSYNAQDVVHAAGAAGADVMEYPGSRHVRVDSHYLGSHSWDDLYREPCSVTLERPISR